MISDNNIISQSERVSTRCPQRGGARIFCRRRRSRSRGSRGRRRRIYSCSMILWRELESPAGSPARDT